MGGEGARRSPVTPIPLGTDSVFLAAAARMEQQPMGKYWFTDQTPEDKAAWRKAGSPSSFRVWSNDHYGTYTSQPGPWRADRPQAHAGGGYLGDQQVLVKPGGEYRTRKPGFVINYWLERGSGWTDKKPVPPRKPPFAH
jgi:hypothetical protein